MHRSQTRADELDAIAGVVAAVAAMGIIFLVFPASADAQCRLCIEEDPGSGWVHYFDLVEPGDYSEPHDDMRSGQCIEKHTLCFVPESETPVAVAFRNAEEWFARLVTKLERRAEMGDTTELHRLLGRYSGVVRLNWKRGAIQAVSCNGIVVAHVPLREAVVVALLEEE